MPQPNTPNMGLTPPTVGGDSGTWGTETNSNWSLIDAHDHSSGKGVKITPLGININADLSFVGNNATTLRSARLSSQAAALSLGSDVGCLSNVNGNLCWNNNSGTVVQLTNGATVNSAFTSYPSQSVSGTFTIPSNSTVVQYMCSGNTVLNLPASSAMPMGRLFVVADMGGVSSSQPIAIVPNGADTINGVNANYALLCNNAMVTLMTDSAGHWSAQTMYPPPYLDIPASLTTTDTSVHTIFSYAIPLNTSIGMHYVAHAQNSAANNFTTIGVVAASNVAGSISSNDVQGTSVSQGTNPVTGIITSVAGSSLTMTVQASSASSTTWKLIFRIMQM